MQSNALEPKSCACTSSKAILQFKRVVLGLSVVQPLQLPAEHYGDLQLLQALLHDQGSAECGSSRVFEGGTSAHDFIHSLV